MTRIEIDGIRADHTDLELLQLMKADCSATTGRISPFTMKKAHFEIGDVTAELVERKWHEAYRRFYLRPSRVLRKAAQVETWRQLPAYVAAARRFFLRQAHEPKT